MRIILPTNFPNFIFNALKELNFDILASDQTSLSALLELSGQERRVLFIQSELLPEPDPPHSESYAIIALSPSARTEAGFNKSALPHLQGASESQFSGHSTFLNGSGDAEVVHIIYDQQKVRERISIPPDTDEQFLHFNTNGLRELRGKGILLAGFTRTSTGYNAEREPTLFHILGTVIQGRLDFTAPRSHPHSLTAKSTFIIPSGSHCSYQANGPTEFLWVHIHSSAFRKGLGDKFKQSKLHYPRDLIDYCTRFRTEARNPGFDRDVALGHLAGLIELSVHRSVSALGMNLIHDESRKRLTDVLKTVETYVSTSFSVEDLARMGGISPSRLYRETQRYFGKSPGALIEEIRIRHARELLLHSNYKLDKIAEMTGYSDAFTFSRAFKRITGTAPSTFRSELR